jgi:hypothetical protein
MGSRLAKFILRHNVVNKYKFLKLYLFLLKKAYKLSKEDIKRYIKDMFN